MRGINFRKLFHYQSKGDVFAIKRINRFDVEKRIGYWQQVLEKLERHMLKEQSELVDVKQILEHLRLLQQQEV
jgi:hypothetical protein